MDSIILSFIIDHWIDLVLGLIIFFVATVNFIPPQHAGLQKGYVDDFGNERENDRQSLIMALTNFLFFTLLKSFLVTLSLRGAITLVMLVVVGVELVSTQTISTNAVILSVAAIIALYAEGLIERAKQVSIWKIFSYEAKD